MKTLPIKSPYCLSIRQHSCLRSVIMVIAFILHEKTNFKRIQKNLTIKFFSHLQAIQSLQTIDCRCHGVSGACAHKSCWKRLPEFPKVAKKILQKYDNAVKVTYERSTRSFKPAYYDVTSVRPDHLIYGYNSPNYCDRNEKLGVLGTAGRQCNSTSLGHDHCTLLCCGRGVNIKRVELVERCRCKYYWCCYVKCKQCKRTVDQYTCK